jgi:hypothetical protein
MGGHLIILTARLRHLWPPASIARGGPFFADRENFTRSAAAPHAGCCRRGDSAARRDDAPLPRFGEHTPLRRSLLKARAFPHSALYANGSPWRFTWKRRIFSGSDALILRACIDVPIGSS